MKALCIATCHLREHNYAKFHDHNPVREISNHKMYRKGDFSIVKFDEKDYMVLWKNVIVGEFVGANKELVDLLYSRTEPNENDRPQHYNYVTALSDIEEAPEWAKKYHFTIE